jgi:outer membrane protein assembly factor BamB
MPPTDSASSSRRLRPTRRDLLQALGGTTAVSLAGCTDTLELGPDGSPGASLDTTRETAASYPEDVVMFQQNLRRQAYYPAETVPDSVSVNWAVPHNFVGHTAAKSTPMPTLDGPVLFAGDSGRVEARAPSGRTRWSTLTDATELGFHGSPTVVGDTAYVGGYDGALYALDIQTGAIRWKTTASQLDGTLAVGSSPAYHDGVLYFIVEYWDPSSGALWAIDPANGDPLWHDDRLWGQPHPSPTIDREVGRICAGSNDGTVYCWEYPSLDFAWTYQAGPEGGPQGREKAGGQFRLGAEIKGTVAAYAGKGYVGSWDHRLHCIDLATGEGLWTFDTGGANMSNPAVDPSRGVVYTGSDSGFVFALDAETGQQLWEADVNGRVIGALTTTGETVLAGSYDSHLYALDAATGRQRWRVPNRGRVTSGLILAGDSTPDL